jgi:hypothetical protein
MIGARREMTRCGHGMRCVVRWLATAGWLLLRMMWDVGWIFAICDLTDEPVCAPNGRNTVPFA